MATPTALAPMELQAATSLAEAVNGAEDEPQKAGDALANGLLKDQLVDQANDIGAIVDNGVHANIDVDLVHSDEADVLGNGEVHLHVAPEAEDAMEDEGADEQGDEQIPLLRGASSPASNCPPITRAQDLAPFMVAEVDIKKKKNKKVRKFYRNQNEVINDLLTLDEQLNQIDAGVALSVADEGEVTFLTTISFIANVVLLVLKVIAAVVSGSLSVLASATDSLLDIVSGSFLFCVDRFINKIEPYSYPIGKAKMEPLGIMMFAAIMGMTSVQIIREAIQTLIVGFTVKPPIVSLNAWTLSILGGTIVVKGVLYLLCRFLGGTSSMVEALQDDHRNDMITNLVAAACAFIGWYWPKLWYFDAAGAILFGVFILVNWILAGKEQIGLLIGSSAPPNLIGQLVYLTAKHDERIERVDTVRCYRLGQNYLAEVDIVLPETMTVKESHDIGESLQFKLEKLEVVQRAFVHVDYEWEHSPEH